MGDRISIQFENGGEKSVALFSHWGGMEFVDEAVTYVKELIGNGITPLGRKEPNTVMIDFIREITKDMKVVDGDIYLGVDGSDGDNSDNGHFIIDLQSGNRNKR